MMRRVRIITPNDNGFRFLDQATPVMDRAL